MENNTIITCAQFKFYANFDSANLARVEHVPESRMCRVVTFCDDPAPDMEFNIWTKPDAYGTPHENSNRSWFYFGVQSPTPCKLVRFNIMNLNRHGKLFDQGMAPVYQVLPGKLIWDRVPGKPRYKAQDDKFIVSFTFRITGKVSTITYFAYTYPFTYTKLQKMLMDLDRIYFRRMNKSKDNIYYIREIVTNSIEGRNVDLITISSYHGITKQREARLRNLFTNDTPRPFRFSGKRVIFISSRVHPGETPSSFVLHGLMKLLLDEHDPISKTLRRLYVFKIIPFLNPDGVANGHYRTDSRGVNLNRAYLRPSCIYHPSVYAARALVRYYHFGFEKEEDAECNEFVYSSPSYENATNVMHMSEQIQMNLSKVDQRGDNTSVIENSGGDILRAHSENPSNYIRIEGTLSVTPMDTGNMRRKKRWYTKIFNFLLRCGNRRTQRNQEHLDEHLYEIEAYPDERSGLFMYLDLHAHATKQGIFIFGNHFNDVERNVECRLFPKLMSINNCNFDFKNCNFSKKNMFLKQKTDGICRTGCGRIAVMLATGITRSYTLECNYNTGRVVNFLPPTVRDIKTGERVVRITTPPVYTPKIFEEVGRSIGAALLDMTEQNPNSRLPNSVFCTLDNLREWLRALAIHDNIDGPARIRTRGAREILPMKNFPEQLQSLDKFKQDVTLIYKT